MKPASAKLQNRNKVYATPIGLELHGREIWMGAGGEGIMNLAQKTTYHGDLQPARVRMWHSPTIPKKPPLFPVCFRCLEIFNNPWLFSDLKRSELPEAPTRILEMWSLTVGLDTANNRFSHLCCFYQLSIYIFVKSFEVQSCWTIQCHIFTTRNPIFLNRRHSYKPSFATTTGKRDNPTWHIIPDSSTINHHQINLVNGQCHPSHWWRIGLRC